MNATKFCTTLLLVLTTMVQVNGQMDVLFKNIKGDGRYREFTAVCLKGVPLAQPNTPEGVLRTDPGTGGKLTIQTVDKRNNKAINAVGFMLAIKDPATSAVWMVSDRVMYEVDLEILLQKCNGNETLIFITTDRRYRLPRNEIALGNG